MYKLFPKLVWNLLLFIYGLVVLAALWVMDFFGAATSEITMIRYLGLIIFFIFSYWIGAANYYSGWRMIWRKVPALNKLFFPDLNGVWQGNTESNWSVIKKIKNAANSTDILDDAELDQTQLQTDEILLEIRASLFGIKVFAKLPNTGGESYSSTASVNRDSDNESVVLSYVYKQSTPSPNSTDQDSHTGAAELRWNKCFSEELKGNYWTRRSWRRGLNTAGLMNLKKVDSRKDEGKCLEHYLIK